MHIFTTTKNQKRGVAQDFKSASKKEKNTCTFKTL